VREKLNGPGVPWGHREEDQSLPRRRVVFPNQVLDRAPPIANKDDKAIQRSHGIINDNVPAHELLANNARDTNFVTMGQGGGRNHHRPVSRINRNHIIAKSQSLMSALMPQGHGLPSGYMEDLPPAVQNRIKAFKNLSERRTRLRKFIDGELSQYQFEHKEKTGHHLPADIVSPPKPEPTDLESMSLPIWEHPPVKDVSSISPERDAPPDPQPPMRRQRAAYFHSQTRQPVQEGRRNATNTMSYMPARLLI